jgi:adenylate kinase
MTELNLVLLGPPGAGKGTQATHLHRAWNIPHISTGNILREAVREQTPLGREVEAVLASGGLVDDRLITGIVDARLRQDDCRAGFLLDGFPRTVAQAGALDRMLAGRAPLVVVEIACPDEDIIRRLASRVVCSECGKNAQEEGEHATCHDCGGLLVQRADDKATVIRNRLEVYHAQTAPLIEYYAPRKTFCRVNGAQLFDAVAADITRAIQRARLGD